MFLASAQSLLVNFGNQNLIWIRSIIQNFLDCKNFLISIVVDWLKRLIRCV